MSPRLRIRLLSAAIAAAACAVLGAGDALAYCRSTTCVGDCARDDDDCKLDGAKLYWPGMCVGFSLNVQASEFIALETFRPVAQASFAAWSDVDCGTGFATIAFLEQDDVDCHNAEFNQDGANANIILFQDTKWIYKGVDNTLAKTTVTYDTETGEIFDADIELNHAYNEFTIDDENVIYDLQSILTHEVGHFIGMDHTPDFLATMNAGYQSGSIELRNIESDDEAGACDAYPPDRGVQCNFQARGGFTSACLSGASEEDDGGGGCSLSRAPARSSSPGAWALLALLVAAPRRRIHGLCSRLLRSLGYTP